jgi:hypothetical protein
MNNWQALLLFGVEEPEQLPNSHLSNSVFPDFVSAKTELETALNFANQAGYSEAQGMLINGKKRFKLAGGIIALCK